MNIVVAQSGGPTVAINSSLLGVFTQAGKYAEIDKVYGSVNGIEGLIYGNLVDLTDIIKTDDDIDLIRQTPSTVLGSCRYKLPDYNTDSEVYEKIVKNLKKNDISAFFYIGGNDSMDTVMKLHAYFEANGIDVKAIGVPKTIDNDLPETDHTPGFGSAAKYVATTMFEITRDSSVYSIPSVTIVEIMGRDTGWLTASSALLRANGESAPHLIYLPEKPFSCKQFVEDVKRVQKKHTSVIVALSEGVELNPDEVEENFQSGKNDIFGHKYLAGVARSLEKVVTKEVGCKVRSIELNVMQRCSSHLLSKRDIVEAELVGGAAVEAALKGKSGVMMAFVRVSDKPYNIKIEPVDVSLVANRVKYFPDEWINKKGNDVTRDVIDYCLPLIQGEPTIRTKNGLPQHYILPKK